MSLPLLVIIVAFGIAAVVIAVHLTGGSQVASLNDESAARVRFALDYPDVPVQHVWLTSDRKAAILELADGRAGLVHATGGKFLTRLVGPPDLAGAPRASGGRLMLRLRDFTWPGGIFEFADAADAQGAEALFSRQRSDGLWKEG